MPTERAGETPSLLNRKARLEEALRDAEAALRRVFAEINRWPFPFGLTRVQMGTRQLREEAAVLLARISEANRPSPSAKLVSGYATNREIVRF